MMDAKAAQPVGKHPKLITGHILLLLACSFILFRGVNSKTDIIGHQALSRFTGSEQDGNPPAPVHGLAAHPRIFKATGRPPEISTTPVHKAPMDVNETKEEVLLLRLLITPASSAIINASSQMDVEETISQSYEPSPSAAATPTDSRGLLESSRVFEVSDSGVSSRAQPLLLGIGHKHLESSMASADEMPFTMPTPKVPGVSSGVVRIPESRHSNVLTTASALLPTLTLGPKSDSHTWHDKRDTFWSIKPTVSKPPSEVLLSTMTPGNSSEVVALDSDRLVVASATSTINLSVVHELTSATVMYISLATDRWSNEDAPLQQPSSDSQVRKEEFGLPAGTVAGIVVASIGFVAIVAAVLGLFIFRRFRGLNAKSYDSKYSGDSCSYLDSLQVSYINSHIELPKESSEEMFSLDNDSFLNSLEAMTMENYWAEDRRSTRV